MLECQLVTDVIDGVVAMETVHGTPINEFLSQSGIYQLVIMLCVYS